MIRRAMVVVAVLSFISACGGEEEPDLTEAQGAVTSATLHLAPAAGSATNFGQALVGTSLIETYVVTNVGIRQTSSRLTLTVTDTDFSFVAPGSGDCVSGTTALGPGQTCTVHVRFAPIAVGARSATLTVHARVGGSANLALSGTGVAPAALVITPSSFAFPSTAVNSTSATATFTVINAGGTPTGVLTTTLNNSSDFVITPGGAGSCAGNLASGASCTIGVAFRPAAAGVRSAQLTVSAIPGGSVVAALTGTGL